MILGVILGVAGGGIVGFLAGARYCVRRMLPNVLARMPTEELNQLAADAGRLRGQ